jgi:hypothetical protein
MPHERRLGNTLYEILTQRVREIYQKGGKARQADIMRACHRLRQTPKLLLLPHGKARKAANYN